MNRQQVAGAVLVALCVHIALQALRLFFPLTVFQFPVWLNDITQVDVGVTLVTAVFALLLVPVLSRPLGPVRVLSVLVLSMAGLRLAWQATPEATPNNALLFVLCAVAWMALYATWRTLPARTWLLGLLLGLPLDAALNGAFYTWDYAWQRSALAWTVTLAVCGAVVLAWWWSRERAALPKTPISAYVAVLVYLALQILYLNNTGYAALALGGSVAGANAVVLLSGTLALLALARPLSTNRGWLAWAIGCAATLLLASARQQVGAALLWPLAQVCLAQVLWQLHTPVTARPAPLWRELTVLSVGLLAFGVAIGLQFARVITVPVLSAFTLQLPTAIVALVLLALLSRKQNAALSPLPARFELGPALLLLVPLGWGVTQAPVADAAPLDDRLRVMTYNIRQGLNNEGWANLEAVAQSIEREEPDVLLLQEVSRGVFPNANVDTLGWLARRLEMRYVFAQAGNSQFGNATLTRLPITATDSATLTTTQRQPRNYLRVTLDLGLEAPVQIINTHLDHISTEARQAQIDDVLAAWDGAPRTLLGGDLNAQPGRPTIIILEDAGLVSGQDVTGNGALHTYAAFDPFMRLDYIFGTPDWTFTGSAVPASLASDHLAVVVDVALE